MDISASEYYQEVDVFFREILPREFASAVREGQVEMAREVARAFWEEGLTAIEAGTGIGKSLAYLVPALLWRLHGGAVAPIVSTRTLNLQDQLLTKDIPLLQRLLFERYQRRIVVAQARGFSNYLCRRRLVGALQKLDELEPSQARTLKQVVEKVNRHDDRYGLFNYESSAEDAIAGVRGDFAVGSELWSFIRCDNWLCSKRRCRNFKDCFLFEERRRLDMADLIVANHSLVLADAALRRDGAKGILPSQERLIFDEAHSLELVATEQLSSNFSLSECNALLRHLLSSGEGLLDEEGLLPRLAALGMYFSQRESISGWQSLLDRLQYGVLDNLEQEIVEFFEDWQQLYAERALQDAKLVLTRELVDAERDANSSLRKRADRIGQLLHDSVANLAEISTLIDSEGEGPLAELSDDVNAAAETLRRLRASLERVFSLDDPEWIIWDERSVYYFSIKAFSLHLGGYLREYMFRDLRTLVMASATLKVNRSMDYFLERLGLREAGAPETANPREAARPGSPGARESEASAPAKAAGGNAASASSCDKVATLTCVSPFDYRRQALLAVATDVPDSLNDMNYFAAKVVEPLARLITSLRGRTLVLCTSRKSLREFGDMLARRLEGEAIRVLCQNEGAGRSRAALIKEFSADQRCVLVGTDSFWEGVDVPGEALQCVIVVKLPFVVPSEPIHKARMEQIEARGGRSFWEYSLPLAITKLRQGVGRLIRTSTDKGVILILDSRLCSKSYGANIINSLPPCTLMRRPLDTVVEASISWMGLGDGQTRFY